MLESEPVMISPFLEMTENETMILRASLNDKKKSFGFYIIFFSQSINRIYIVSAAGRIFRAQKDNRIREFEDRIEMNLDKRASRCCDFTQSSRNW